jgi:hypothetical protein
MTTEGGGWTKVTSAVSNDLVHRLLGSSGRQMLKCADGPELLDGGVTGDAGEEAYIESPSFVSPATVGVPGSVDWAWDAGRAVQVGGIWRVNGADQSCGTDPEYTQVACAASWGVGCGNGPGIDNKLFPGILDQPTPQFCADTTSAHTNAAFSVCAPGYGPYNYRTYSVFVRAD